MTDGDALKAVTNVTTLRELHVSQAGLTCPRYFPGTFWQFLHACDQIAPHEHQATQNAFGGCREQVLRGRGG